MEDNIISYTTAKLAYEKGFNVPCLYYYDSNKHVQRVPNKVYTELGTIKNSDINIYSNYFAAPTQAMLAKWLREKHNRYIEIRLCANSRSTYRICSLDGTGIINAQEEILQFKTYEKAMEHALKNALKSIK